jgi:hypothetical protein
LPISTPIILHEQLVAAPRRTYKKWDKNALPTRSTRKVSKEFLDKKKRDEEAFSNFLAQRYDNTHHRILPSTGAISFTDPTPILSTSLNTSSSNLIVNPTTMPSNILPTNSTSQTVNSSSSNNHIVEYAIGREGKRVIFSEDIDNNNDIPVIITNNAKSVKSSITSTSNKNSEDNTDTHSSSDFPQATPFANPLQALITPSSEPLLTYYCQ